jgi:hypothetical protein
MALCRIENMYLNGVIPSGKRLYFRCPSCGKEIKVRSLWRNLLALPGCLLFAIMFTLFLFIREWGPGVLAAILAFFPLVLLSEIWTRINYPTRTAPVRATENED